MDNQGGRGEVMKGKWKWKPDESQDENVDTAVGKDSQSVWAC